MSQSKQFDLHALEVFVAVQEAGGMTSAGERLGLSQSGVSQVVRKLERDLGAELVDRTVRPPKLTPSGRALYGRAKQILEDVAETRHYVRQIADVPTPLLRIGLMESFATTIAPFLAGGLRDVAGHCKVLSGLAPQLTQLFLSREVDIIVTMDGELEGGQGLRHIDLLIEPYVLALPKSFKGPVDSWQDLAACLDLVRYTDRSAMGAHIERHVRRVKATPPLYLEFDTSTAVLAMVNANIGWAVTTPLCVLQAASHLRNVRLAPVPKPGFRRRIRLVHRRGEFGGMPERLAGDSIKTFRQECLPALEKLAPWVVRDIVTG